jgi:hypothetical protein
MYSAGILTGKAEFTTPKSCELDNGKNFCFQLVTRGTS